MAATRSTRLMRAVILTLLLFAAAACSSGSRDLPRWADVSFAGWERGPGILSEEDGCLYWTQEGSRYLLVFPPYLGEWDGKVLRLGTFEFSPGDGMRGIWGGSGGPSRDDAFWDSPPARRCDASLIAIVHPIGPDNGPNWGYTPQPRD